MTAVMTGSSAKTRKAETAASAVPGVAPAEAAISRATGNQAAGSTASGAVAATDTGLRFQD